jgi:hypothetical protein
MLVIFDFNQSKNNSIYSYGIINIIWYYLLTDPVFLNKGEFDELVRTLQEDKVVLKLLSK